MSPLTIPQVSYERVLRMVGVTIIGIITIGYMFFQARNLIEGPAIVLSETPPVLDTNFVELQGYVRNVVVVRMNGREIHTDEAGHFTHTLTLPHGYTVMTLEAEDRYGRRETITRSFVYQG